MFISRERRWLSDTLVQTRIRQPIDWLRSRRLRSQEERQLRSLEAQVDMSIWFQQERSMLLHGLFDLYGSDKGSVIGGSPYYPWLPHSYADVYSTLFDHCRYSVQTIFECGIGTNRTEFISNMSEQGRPGASLRAWRDYFPNAQIIGADVDSSVLFTEERIQSYSVDQTNPGSIREMWLRAGDPALDLVVDDGLHTLDAAISLLDGTWHLLRQEGIYVIEDVQLHLLDSYRRHLDEFPAWVTYVLMPNKVEGRVGDNCLVVLRKPGPQAH